MPAVDIETSVEHGMIDDGCTDAIITSCAGGIKAAIWAQENLNILGASDAASTKLKTSLDGAIEQLLCQTHAAAAKSIREGKLGPAARTWLTIGVIFGLVSVWSWLSSRS